MSLLLLFAGATPSGAVVLHAAACERTVRSLTAQRTLVDLAPDRTVASTTPRRTVTCED